MRLQLVSAMRAGWLQPYPSFSPGGPASMEQVRSAARQPQPNAVKSAQRGYKGGTERELTGPPCGVTRAYLHGRCRYCVTLASQPGLYVLGEATA